MEWIREHLWESWLIAAVALGAIEMLGLDLIFLMLALGCLVAMVAALIGAPLGLQIAAALVASVAGLLLLRPSLLKRMHSGEDLVTGPANLVGSTGRLTLDASVDEPGRVKIGGEDWSAVPDDPTVRIPAGHNVDVVAIRGATAVVRVLPPSLPQSDTQSGNQPDTTS